MKTRFAICAALVCITATIAAGQQVSVNYNHAQSFAKPVYPKSQSNILSPRIRQREVAQK